MRNPSRLALVASLLNLLFMQQAAAQVYQCLDAGGKKVFSQLPCATQGGNGEQLIMRAPGGTPAPAAPAAGMPLKGEPGVLYGNGSAAPAPKDWAAENAAANARAAAADASAGRSGQAAPSALGGLRKPTPTSAGATDKQIIAHCEANHGARCSSAGEIAQRRMEQRVLSPSEREQQQRAVSDRRQREREEAFNRIIRR
ncbi:DUF4124 domain-containing protein [Polaromonas aquatica]|uniref:DUF4124 domain-containing protein n=1 Tax=Polaromonas aquatica TaxID=332657 RepID=UPI003D6510A1